MRIGSLWCGFSSNPYTGEGAQPLTLCAEGAGVGHPISPPIPIPT